MENKVISDRPTALENGFSKNKIFQSQDVSKRRTKIVCTLG